jgi:restriction system protein
VYEIELFHRGLNKHRLIRGRDLAVVERKAALQEAQWNEQWERKSALEAARTERQGRAAEATARSEEAKRSIDDMHLILHGTLQVDDAIDWESLKVNPNYGVAMPEEPFAYTFAPNLTFFDHIFLSPAGK